MTRIEEIDLAFLKHGTDKASTGHNYAMIYARIPPQATSILEIGVSTGSSIRAWLEIFPIAKVYGIDISPPEKPVVDSRYEFTESNINLYTCPGDRKFDLVVDDASHNAHDMIAGWRALHNHCRGLYVIEDVSRNLADEVLQVMEEDSGINSVIQTKMGGDSRVIVGQFDRVIEW